MHTLEKSALFRVNLQDDVKVKVKLLSRVQLFVTPCSVALQAPLSMGFSRQEESGVGCLQGSSRPRDRTRVSCVSCTGWQVLYH